MDSTLAGFKRLSIKRRDMSLIFNPEIQMPNGIKATGSLYNVNRTKTQYTNALVHQICYSDINNFLARSKY
jgi:hypothetical protein